MTQRSIDLVTYDTDGDVRVRVSIQYVNGSHRWPRGYYLTARAFEDAGNGIEVYNPMHGVRMPFKSAGRFSAKRLGQLAQSVDPTTLRDVAHRSAATAGVTLLSEVTT